MWTQSYYEDALTVEELVQNGVDLLDKVRPGWERLIDTDTLEVSSARRCILGQVYKTEAHAEDNSLSACGFDWAIEHLDDLRNNNHYTYGFTSYRMVSWPELNDEWRKVIAERV